VNPLALSTRLGKKLLLEGKECLFFNGTSYLGLDSLEAYIRIVESNVQKWGTHHGLSRTNNVRLAIYDAFEEFFSNQVGAESGALFSSGYLAGIAASQYLFPKVDQCWAAPDTHPAILPSGVQAEPFGSYSQWTHACLDRASQLPSQKILILGNAVDPLKAEIHAYDWVLPIAEKHEVTLLIDDSHAFGVLGDILFGTYSQWKQEGIQLLVSGSLGKGLATPGGIVLGTEDLIQGVKSQSIFVGASPPAPALLQSFLDAQLLLQEQQGKLQDLTSFFYQQSRHLPQITGNPNFPVFVYSPDLWAEKLQEQGYITSSFPYPTASGPKVNRMVLSASHTREELSALSQMLAHLVTAL
jgi:7-keto-8-aminopelargonate synthetase-like enzyme